MGSEAAGRLDGWITIVIIPHTTAFPQVTKQVTELRILHNDQRTSYEMRHRKVTKKEDLKCVLSRLN